jgi:hypothetical protein
MNKLIYVLALAAMLVSIACSETKNLEFIKSSVVQFDKNGRATIYLHNAGSIDRMRVKSYLKTSRFEIIDKSKVTLWEMALNDSLYKFTETRGDNVNIIKCESKNHIVISKSTVPDHP